MFRRRKNREQDLERELRAHLDQESEERGDLYAARRALGNTALIKEEVREMWGWMRLERLAQDVRYAARVLRRSPGFTAVAVISLALGIGANTALFSALDAVMWKSLPVRDPQDLRILTWGQTKAETARAFEHDFTGYGGKDPKTGRTMRSSFSYSAYASLRDHVPQLSDVVGFSDNQFTLTAKGSSEYVFGWFVSGNYFAALGVVPAAGRLVTPEDDAPGRPAVVVLTHRYWEKRFGLDPQVIGREVTINQTRATVIGVTPSTFQGLNPGEAPELFVPLSMAVLGGADYSMTDPYTWWVQIFGRLRRGETDASAAAGAQTVFTGVIESYAGPPASETDMPRVLISAGGKGVGNFRSRQDSLYVLAAVVAVVLLIACANLASLMLARSQARRREIAVRLSIGASRGRLIRQLMTESLVLSGAAGVLGVFLAEPLLGLVLRMIGGADNLSLDARLDGRTLLFTFGASILTGALFGVLPAWRATRVDLTPALKDGGAATGGRDSRLNASRVLVAAQVGFSIVMLAGAGLFVRTLLNLMTVDVGFRTSGLLTFRTDPSRNGYAKDRLADVYARMRAEIEAIPGVASVGMSRHGLLEDGQGSSSFYLPGDGNKGDSVYTHFCSESFLTTMHIPVLKGRDLAASDDSGSPKVAVVNQTFVKQFLGGQEPIGLVFAFGDSRRPSPADERVQIVGVAKDAHYASVRADVPPTVYLPYVQSLNSLRQMTFAMRTNVPPLSIANAVRKAVAKIDPTIPVAQMRTMDDQAAESIGRERLMAELVSGFGVLAALLAAIGIFGVMAYTVARRTREIGIRLALGATAGGVRWMVLRESVAIVAAGLAAGVPAAFALSRLAASLLYGVRPHDAWSFAAAVLLMAAVGAAAAWIPARRASRVDPMAALRSE